MQEKYDWGVYEMFKEQLDQQIPYVEANILSLNNSEKVSDAVDDLFRAYHNFKATSQYLSLKQMANHTSKAETVLSALREERKIVPEEIIDWLLKSVDQLTLWLNEMHTNTINLSETPKDLNKKVKLTRSYISPKDQLKKLNVLYIDKNQKRVEKIVPFLKKLVSETRSENNIDSAKNLIKSYKYDILIVNFNEDNYELVELSKEVHPNKPVLVIFDKIDFSCKKKLLKSEINHAITNPLDAKLFQRELIYIAKTHFNSQSVIIENKMISEFIQNLKPLPNTIFQIIQICDDDELPVKDLIKVIKSDPIISANILKVANSPLYSSTEVKTIDQAITKLGKRAIKALSMVGLRNNLGEIDLKAYKIDENIFSDVSMKRLSLMLKWYSKVSIADLTILSSTSLLGNLGQILISREITRMKALDQFNNLCNTFSITQAEEKIVHTTTTIITSQILSYWKLSSDIVNTIAYSDNPDEAPEELKRFIIANNIVYRLIEIDGTVLDEIPDDVLVLMDENNLDVAPLQKALDNIKSI